MGLRYQRRKNLRGGMFVTLGMRGPRIGVRRGRATGSIGASGPSFTVRLARGLSYLFRP
jgi:hypothetical protein